MEIRKGNKFECLDSISIGNYVYYTKGMIYESDIDGCITNNFGNKSHSITSDFVDAHFKYINNMEEKKEDRVSHPSHYTWLKEKCGIEVIDITRHLSFDTGNAVKYLLRAGHKQEEGYTTKEKQIEDLKKAIFYINDELNQLYGKTDNS